MEKLIEIGGYVLFGLWGVLATVLPAVLMRFQFRKEKHPEKAQGTRNVLATMAFLFVPIILVGNLATSLIKWFWGEDPLWGGCSLFRCGWQWCWG